MVPLEACFTQKGDKSHVNSPMGPDPGVAAMADNIRDNLSARGCRAAAMGAVFRFVADRCVSRMTDGIPTLASPTRTQESHPDCAYRSSGCCRHAIDGCRGLPVRRPTLQVYKGVSLGGYIAHLEVSCPYYIVRRTRVQVCMVVTDLLRG